MNLNEKSNRPRITKTQFFKEVCRFADCANTETPAKYWSAIYEVIVRHLYYDECIKVPFLGTFSLREVGESIQVQTDADGNEVVYRVPARRVPVFTPEDNFIDDVNMTGVTKAYRKRLKKGTLTQRDYERKCRAEALNVDGNLPEKYAEAAKEKFAESLKEKVKKFKGKADLKDDEE